MFYWNSEYSRSNRKKCSTQLKGDKNDDIDQHDKMINFYRNEHFGTDSLMRTKSVGALINTINLNAELNTNIVPYRLSQRKLTPDLNSFILLTNQGTF